MPSSLTSSLHLALSGGCVCSGFSREEVEEHRSNMVNAYEFALVQIGIAVDSTQLWWEYISFVKGEQNSIYVTYGTGMKL
jgi:hypothetical protein